MLDAARIIGSGEPGDYGLSPVEHAAHLKDSAPQLAALLTRSAPVELARQYADADTEALAAERTFKRWVIRANWAVLASATVSALLMAAALLAGRLGGLTQTILIVLALIGVATGGFASMSLFRVKEGRLLEDWMTARARAETKRLSYFNYIVNSSAGPLDIELELLKLEYFRRYQLDLQLAYYKTRRSGHRNSAERTLSISAGSVLVAAFRCGRSARCAEERMGCARFACGVRCRTRDAVRRRKVAVLLGLDPGQDARGRCGKEAEQVEAVQAERLEGAADEACDFEDNAGEHPAACSPIVR